MSLEGKHMYIYDRPLVTSRLGCDEHTTNFQPSQIYNIPHHCDRVQEWYGLAQDKPAARSYNQPGQPLDLQSDYILAPEVMDAIGTLLSTQVPRTHLAGADPLMIERGLIIYRYDDGRLRIGDVSFGTKGLRTSAGTTRYSVKLEYHTFMDAGTGQEAYPWLYTHTHPAVQKFPEVPSGIYPENSMFVGDLHVLRNEPTRQIGIMTIGVNSVITNFLNAPQRIPFTLAIRDPIVGPAEYNTDYRPTPTLETHNAAAAALRRIFKGRTISGYYTGDLRTGRAVPYLSAREQRKLKAKPGR
jgi:hypothetical protein